eukprot:TRINITY_DN9078_c0_g1_i1.p1 TRINITY_DN9078_c0_g1~~TRINITY_DN9078_c0_g1_i1.p1  ORF type:complete len:103 (-),score=32.82 TRINITY_DN9078_c0_g1_i1:80-388(-)
MSRHTIVLMQPERSRASRTFNDYADVSSALDGIAQMFEQALRQEHRGSKNITYDISQLHRFIDSIEDLVALVFDGRINAYVPHDKTWIKSQLVLHFKRQANQ